MSYPAIDWLHLARAIGSVEDDRSVRGGTHVAQLALEKILGTANIREAVDLVLNVAPSAELVISVLSHIRSAEATQLAYDAYKTTTGRPASEAVRLIARIAHPMALAWVDEFIADEHVVGWGMSLLDQLLWTNAVDPDTPAIQRLLARVEHHPKPHIRIHAEFVQTYLKTRSMTVQSERPSKTNPSSPDVSPR